MDVVEIGNCNNYTAQEENAININNDKNNSLFNNSNFEDVFCKNNKKNNKMLDYNDLKKQIFLILKRHKISVITEYNIWNTFFLIKRYIYSNTLCFEYDKSIKKILLECLRDDVVLQ